MPMYTVPELDKESTEAIPPMRPLPILHLHDRKKMDVCLINLNKGEDDKGCLKCCNILKWVQLCKDNYWRVA
jgi:hypothetical protein